MTMEKYVIDVKKLFNKDEVTSIESGPLLYDEIKKKIDDANGDSLIIIDFSGINKITTIVINESIGKFIAENGIKEVAKMIQLCGIKKNLRKYFEISISKNISIYEARNKSSN